MDFENEILDGLGADRFQSVSHRNGVSVLAAVRHGSLLANIKVAQGTLLELLALVRSRHAA